MKRNILKIIICLTLILSMVAAPVCASAGSTAYIFKVNRSEVRLRAQKGVNSRVVTLLNRGTKVLYCGNRDDEMYKVYTASGKTGYVWREYLSAYGAIKKSKIGVTTKRTPVYKMVGGKMKRMGTVNKGTMVLVYGETSSWARCKSISGKTAYIARSALKKAF